VGAPAPIVNSTKPLIGVVGPCKSGKSTLVRGLISNGYKAQRIAQEHSFAPQMWELISKPDILIFLDCNHETTLRRGLNWTRQEYDAQQPRLAHARQNADLHVHSDELTVREVLEKVLKYLREASKR
jgi:guanylate kinase